MKRLFLLLLTAIMLFSFTACGETEAVQSEAEESAAESSSENKTEDEPLLISDDGRLNYEYYKQTAPWMPSPDQIPTIQEAKQGTPVGNNTDWEPIDVIETDIKVDADLLPIVTNETPLESMISEIDDPFLYTAFSWGITAGFPTSRNHPTLQQMLTRNPEGNNDIAYRIPINFLRQTEEGSYYTVCRLKGGGYIYYVFYNDPVDTDNIYLWGGIYSEKKVSYSDFSDLKTGDGIEKVINVDPSAKMCLSTYIYNKNMLGATSFSPEKQVMLLTDGILEITYELRDMSEVEAPAGYTYVPCDSDDLVIASIEYYPDFIYLSSSAMESGLTNSETSLPIHILPQDYPPAN